MTSKKNPAALFLALALIVCMLTGCMGEEFSVTLNSDGTCAYLMKYLYEQSMYDSMMADAGTNDSTILSTGDFTQTTETINGMTYYAFSRSFTFSNVDSMRSFLTDNTAFYNGMVEGSKKPENYAASKESLIAPFSSVTLDASGFYASLSTDNPMLSDSSLASDDAAVDMGGISKSDLDGYDSLYGYYQAQGIIIKISIALPSAITDSNGTISGNTAAWDLSNLPDDNKLIAVTNGTPIASDTTAPTISGVKNNGIYNKTVTVEGTDDVSLPSFSLNGLRFNTNKFTISTSGKYTVIATDANNNSTTVKFTVDTKKPVIKGLKSGKIPKKGLTLKFSDNLGIKSVKINGKKANKKKVTLKKAGKYVVKVTDKAGNVTTAKFRLQSK